MITKNRNWVWWGVAMALTIAKLWLTRGQGIFAIGNAGHDDLLFIDLARHLIYGDWLGPYNELTLSKGPFYPLFIAASFWIGIPLFLSQHLFYTLACALFVRALKPAISSCGFRVLIYVTLLWNPMTFDMPGMGRVLRQQVYGPLVLLIFGGLVALYFRRRESNRHLIPWSILTGLSAGAFYLTREETLWILPSILLLSVACLINSREESTRHMRRAAGHIGLVLVTATVPVFTVSALNKQHYGWFGTCEFRAPEFKQAYGAMSRVRVGPELRHIPVTRQAREAIATASPKFAELQVQFDAGLANNWAKASEFFTHLPSEEGQIGGGWFVWALRDATARSGHGHSASEAISFYGQLAREINLACDQGQLPAGPSRSSFLPVWNQNQAGDFVHNLRIFTDYVARFSQFSARPNPSQGSPEQLQLFRTITRERISPPQGEYDVVGADRYLLNVSKTNTLHRIGKAIRPFFPFLIYLSLAAVFFRSIWMLWHHRWNYPLTLALSAAGACAASVIIHSFIETTSFPVLTVTSFAPIYPLLLLLIVATFWDIIAAWKTRPSLFFGGILESTRKVAIDSAEFPLKSGHWITTALGLTALLPLLIWNREFRELIWFGDDFFLLDQLAQMGLLKWSTLVFSENFVPLFKVLWGQAVFTFNGSYLVMLWLLWLTHALNAALFAKILQRSGFTLPATIISTMVFALIPANIETLGWSVQWSAVLATFFMLVGINWLLRFPNPTATFSWRIHLPLFLCATASACSFSRGVLTGGVLALGLLLPVVFSFRAKSLMRSLPGILLSLLPAITVALIIKLNSSGNHQNMMGHWGDILEFGTTYFLLNPCNSLLGHTSLHPFAIILMGGGKISLIVVALRVSRGSVRHLLILMLAYDLGNALLLGIGRYHTGFFAALSSRYQYSSLIATLPFAGLLLTKALTLITPSRIRYGFTGIIAVAAAYYCLRGWPSTLKAFTSWRGTELRALIAEPTTSDPTVKTPALEFMHIERAKALQRAYNLH